MSSYYSKPLYTPKNLELQWLNNTVSSHDLWCGCNKPWKHLQEILQSRGTQICLTGTVDDKDAGTQTGDDDLDLAPGELERLFAEEDIDDTG